VADTDFGQASIARLDELRLDILRDESPAEPDPRAPRPAEPAPVSNHISHKNTNLRAELTSFVGRDTELRQVAELLGTYRLITLTGPGASTWWPRPPRWPTACWPPARRSVSWPPAP